MKSLVPWWARVGVKLAAARLPVPYAVWAALGLRRHGQMDAPSYALRVFDEHIRRCGRTDDLRGRTILELGPGDSIATALIAHAHGARAILVDAGRWATEDVDAYRPILAALRSEGLDPVDLEFGDTFDTLLARCGGTYITEGTAGMSELPDDSVDLIFSQAVLEHVRRDEFLPMQRECCRVLADGGRASHRVDLKDHLGGRLNQHRFSPDFWESTWVADAGLYVNRLAFSEMLALFEEAGFSVESSAPDRWDGLPTSWRRFHPSQRRLPAEAWDVSGFVAVLSTEAGRD